MATGYMLGQTEENIWGNTRRIRRTVMEDIIGMMGGCFRDNGKRGRGKAEVQFTILMVLKKQGFGRMTKG